MKRYKLLLENRPFLFAVILCFFIFALFLFMFKNNQDVSNTANILHQQQFRTLQTLQTTNKKYIALQNQNQYKLNQSLMATMSAMQKTYKDSISAYQNIVDLRDQKDNTDKLDALYVTAVQYLSQTNWSSASATLTNLNSQIQQEQTKLAQSQIPATTTNTPVSNTAPGSGFSQQQVRTSSGTFTIDIIAADLNSTRVVADTASSSDCGNNCPVMSLSDYVSKNGAYAGINGTFFCPADYPSCAGKINTFDTLLMNKNKTYFNSANNVYSTVPAVIISGTSVRFVSQSLQWGRDTSPDMVLAMQPLLVLNNQVVYGGSGDPKYNEKGTRGFIASKGSTVYIGDVLNANMQDSANVLHTLGMENALNLDEGGSTALWYGGYKLGPGRALPNAVLFIKK